MIRTATFSDCRTWRYTLGRRWSRLPDGDDKPGEVVWLMLNPSVADENAEDRTVSRCISFSNRWGFSRLTVLNLFAFVGTDPRDMKSAVDPVGPMNDETILRVCQSAELVLCAWGNHGAHLGRADTVREMLAGIPLHCLSVTGANHPQHPLYLRGELTPIPLPPLPSVAARG